MLRDKSIAVIVTAYDVAALLPRVIDTMPRFVDAIVVVDDASRDDTAAVATARAASDARIVLLRHRENRGVGAAIATGYVFARDQGFDAAAIMAGDAQMHADDLASVLEPVVCGVADYAKGNRLVRGEWRRIPLVRLVGNVALSVLTKAATGYWHSVDSQCGYTAISRDALLAIEPEAIYPRYGCPNDILAKLNVAGMRVIDVPVRALYGVGEKSGLKVGRAVFTIGWLVVKLFFWRNWQRHVAQDFHPLVLLHALAAALLAASAVAAAAAALAPGSSVAAAGIATLLLVTALLSWLLALWLDREANRSLCVSARHAHGLPGATEPVTDEGAPIAPAVVPR